jgi:hypothetical protein
MLTSSKYRINMYLPVLAEVCMDCTLWRETELSVKREYAVAHRRVAKG